MGGDFYTPYTITVMVTAPKIKKALVLRMFLGIKKTETPIFQGISVVLPKVYLGGYKRIF